MACARRSCAATETSSRFEDIHARTKCIPSCTRRTLFARVFTRTRLPRLDNLAYPVVEVLSPFEVLVCPPLRILSFSWVCRPPFSLICAPPRRSIHFPPYRSRPILRFLQAGFARRYFAMHHKFICAFARTCMYAHIHWRLSWIIPLSGRFSCWCAEQ